MTRWGINLATGVLLVLGTAGCRSTNPALDSVTTAHGNTDWHIDTAEEFLTGKQMDGTPSASNHCPTTWTQTHMHVGETNTNVYYYDADVIAAGKDTDTAKGIDRTMLFFYAGHGRPTYYDALGSTAYVDKMRLGNSAGNNNGILRYFWQCSCEVFAHGPKTCTPATEDYACPEDFDGSADSDAMRNVYQRWGGALAPALRMACGSSTAAYCHENETNKIWDDFNNKGYDVADSWIDGLNRYSWNTPLCITTGGLATSSTPLFDTAFTNAPNSSGSYLHIQYLSGFDSTAPTIFRPRVPDLLPILELVPLPLPEPYARMELKDEGEWRFAVKQVPGRGPAAKVSNLSGALYAFDERKYTEEMQPLDERAYLEAAAEVVAAYGMTEEDALAPVGVRIIIERSPRQDAGQAEIQRFTKSVIVTYGRTIEIGDIKVGVLGAGGSIAVQLNPDGSLYNAAKVWRQVTGTRTTTEAKPYDQALREAEEQIGREQLEGYKLADWTWGYEEEAGNVRQTEMKAVYVFNFMPRDPERKMDFPPRIVKVAAHLGM